MYKIKQQSMYQLFTEFCIGLLFVKYQSKYCAKLTNIYDMMIVSLLIYL